MFSTTTSLRSKTVPVIEIESVSHDLGALQLLAQFGEAFSLLCRFECKEALNVFNTLPPSQFYSPWVLEQVAKLYFELMDFQNVCKPVSLPLTNEWLGTESLWRVKEQSSVQNRRLGYLFNNLVAPTKECWAKLPGAYIGGGGQDVSRKLGSCWELLQLAKRTRSGVKIFQKGWFCCFAALLLCCFSFLRSASPQ